MLFFVLFGCGDSDQSAGNIGVVPGANSGNNSEYQRIRDITLETMGAHYDPEIPFTIGFGDDMFYYRYTGEPIGAEADIKKDSYMWERAKVPEESDYEGYYRIQFERDEDDYLSYRSHLMDREGNIVFTSPEGEHILPKEMAPGKVYYDVDGMLLDKDLKNVVPAGVEYYGTDGGYIEAYEEDNKRHRYLFSMDGELIYEAQNADLLDVKFWDRFERYLFVYEYAPDFAGNHVRVFSLPEMEELFYFERVNEWREYAAPLLLTYDSFNNTTARMYVIKDGEIRIDVQYHFLDDDDDIWLDFSYYRGYFGYHGRGGNYVYDLNTGAYIGNVDKYDFEYRYFRDADDYEIQRHHYIENGYEIPEGRMTEYNETCGWLGLIQYNLFRAMEEAYGARVFMGYKGMPNAFSLYDAATDKILFEVSEASGTTWVMSAPSSDGYGNSQSVFINAASSEGENVLHNVMTGKTVRTKGKLVGFQRVYAVYFYNDTYIVYNFFLDSFSISATDEGT